MIECPLEQGTRIGRFLVLRDIDGRTHAVSLTSIMAVCESDDGSLVLLPGARAIHVEQSLRVVLQWLDPASRF